MAEQTWFKAGGWFRPIEPVLVVKVTEKTVTVRSERFTIGVAANKHDDTRRDKRGQYESFFPTWKEAHAYLLKRAETKLEHARSAVEDAEKKLGNIKSMKQPIADEAKP